MKLSIAAVSYRLLVPISTADGLMHVREGFVVELEGDGVIGRGEAVPMASFGTEPAEVCLCALKGFRIEKAPDTLEAIEEATAFLSSTPAARFALECALLEHLARRRGVAVAALLGSAKRRLPVNALIEGRDATALANSAERAVAQGFGVVKVKVAVRPLAMEAQRLLAVRRAVGPRVGIRLDANGGWTEGEARAALRGLEAIGLELCEQPVAPRDVEGLRRLRNDVPCRLAADETMLMPEVLERLLASDPRPSVDVVVLKPAALGGLLRALAIAKRAAEGGVASFATTLMDGPISRAAAAHLAAVLPGDGWAHGLSTVELFEGVAEDAFTPVKGAIMLPATAGWGV